MVKAPASLVSWLVLTTPFLPVQPADLVVTMGCPHDRIHVLPEGAPKEFTVGVLGIRGTDDAYQQFNATFRDYLTATAGRHFDPPVEFRMKALNFLSLFADSQSAAVDLIYVNPSAFSCIESEFTARSLCSQTSRRNVNGTKYDLKEFGGVIVSRADNPLVRTIADLRGKIVAAASISGLGSGQMQFLEMQKAGMNYINDPKQLVFTSDQDIVVKGVLSGKFDVGFVRTDQIESSTDANGTQLDPSLFRVIDPKPGLHIDGVPFPFASSTPLYPEWNLAALPHLSDTLSLEVQAAMLALADHSTAAIQQNECMAEFNDTVTCDWELMAKARCDTTQDVAALALAAREKGKFSAWQPTLSYMQLRSMQENIGFIKMDPADNVWKCIKPKTLYDSITCPVGYYKALEKDVDEACGREGLECEEGFQCICSPCVAIRECTDGVEIRGNCISYAVLLPAILVPIFLLCAIAVHYYVEYRRKQADMVWTVQPEELLFSTPCKVIGQGTFGYVLLAEYRGTEVAVKRVLPPRDGSNIVRELRGNGGARGSITSAPSAGTASGKATTSVLGHQTELYGETENSGERRGDTDLESQQDFGLKSMMPTRFSTRIDETLENPGLMSRAARRSSLEHSAGKLTYAQLKRDFVREMRHLAKLRHPCITTVMGVVIDGRAEPMLVMEYMTKGSLYDVLRDQFVALDVDEHILPILQDVARGVRFLHAANPEVIHGDLKAKNVLIDSNFRAKVADFGLSANKRRDRASGTPFWMAPELLRGESINSTASDIYAFGILIYEIFSRQNPYEGENHVEVMRAICDPKSNKRPPVPPGCSVQIADLMKECVHAEPSKRPTAELVDVALRVEGSVKERTCKLVELNKKLEEANKKIAMASSMQLEHFACMSHEIRTPLHCIVGIASLMEGTGLNASQQESISMITAASSLLHSIVDDVLDFSKLQSGNAELIIKKTDIQKVVADLVNAMRASSLSRKRNVNIKTRFHGGAPRHVDTDGRRLLQILFNLVSNAVKFSKMDGTVEVNIKVAERVNPFGHVKDSPSDNDEQNEERMPPVVLPRNVLRFTVKDFGKGIEKKNFRCIFQPFTQTESGVSNIDGGTGLGLAITEKLVRALGGDISVDSCLSEWTEFTVDFPLDEPLLCVRDVEVEFQNADIYVVGHDNLVEEILRFFQVSFTRLGNLEELNDTLERYPRTLGASKRAIICVIEADRFDAAIATQLILKCGVKAAVVGPHGGVSESIKHFPCLGEIVPSSFMEDLLDLVKESLEVRTSQPRFLADETKEDLDKPRDLTKMRILCAEDNVVNQKILIRMLKRAGVEDVEVVENGKLAVAREAEKEFDVVLMDMQMPEMDGMTATRLIVQRQGGHRIPIIVFLTAHVSDRFDALCLESGATAYLPKPYTLSILKEVLLEAESKLNQRR